MATPIPETYEHWRHCITVECKIQLTPKFVSERLAVWLKEDSEETRRFRHLYGDRHWRAVVGWFEQAAKDVGAAG